MKIHLKSIYNAKVLSTDMIDLTFKIKYSIINSKIWKLLINIVLNLPDS